MLSQYEIQFMPQKVIKGQVMADFLADHPVPKSSKLYDDLLDEVIEVNIINVSSKEPVCQLFFDGASKTSPKEISSHVWGGSTHFPT